MLHPLGAAAQTPRYRRFGTVQPRPSAPLGGPRAAHVHGHASTAAAYMFPREPPVSRVSANDAGARLEEGTDEVWPVSQLRRLVTRHFQPYVLEADVRSIHAALPPEVGSYAGQVHDIAYGPPPSLGTPAAQPSPPLIVHAATKRRYRRPPLTSLVTAPRRAHAFQFLARTG